MIHSLPWFGDFQNFEICKTSKIMETWFIVLLDFETCMIGKLVKFWDFPVQSRLEDLQDLGIYKIWRLARFFSLQDWETFKVLETHKKKKSKF